MNADVALDFTTATADEPIAAGRTLATELRGGLLLVLRGDLGAGKTTLVKGIAEALDAADPEEVTSPTFTLVHEYTGALPGELAARIHLYHLDLYRLEEERQLLALGIDEMIAPENIVLVEWGEKFSSIVARANGEIFLEHRGGDVRHIVARWTRS